MQLRSSILQRAKLPAAFPVLVFPVGTFTVPGHFLGNMDRETCGILAVRAVPNFLIAVRALAPHAFFVFLDDEFLKLHFFFTAKSRESFTK